MHTAWWRRWHRWIGFPAALILLFAAMTGFLVAATEFFSEAEALREATRYAPGARYCGDFLHAASISSGVMSGIVDRRTEPEAFAARLTASPEAA